MTEEIIIDGELSCNNCLGKTRCKQQQEVKVKRIGAILSYIANEDNEKYIAELKNEIPAITRCDVVLEKQLKRLELEHNTICYNLGLLEQENKELKSRMIGKTGFMCDCTKAEKYRSALEEIKEIAYRGADVNDCTFCHNIYNKINEVLNGN